MTPQRWIEGFPMELHVGDEFDFAYRRGFADVPLVPGQLGSFDLMPADERVHFVITPLGKARIINIESPIPPPEEEEV